MPGQHHTPEVKAQALAAVQLGKGTKTGAIEAGVPLRTVQRWRRDMAQRDAEQWQPDNVQAIHMSTDLIMDAMQDIKEDGDAKKHLIALNAIRGTAIDKMQRAQSPDSGTPNVMVVLGNVEFNR